MTIPMIPVESSNLAACGYDVRTKTLRVQFRSGSTWDYAGVEPALHRGLMEAKSKGGYFAAYIRRPAYTATKVEQTAEAEPGMPAPEPAHEHQ